MKNVNILAVMAIITVGLLIAGGYVYLTRPPAVKVRNGFASYSYSLNNTSIITINRNITSIAVIDNSGTLNLTVNFISVSPIGNEIENDLYITVKGHMPRNLVPSGLKIEAQELEKSASTVDFLTSYDDFSNITPWGSDEIFPGAWAPNPAYIGGSPQKSDFEMKTDIQWEIHDYSTTRVHQVEIKAELLGFSSPVVSTVNITLNTSALGHALLRCHGSVDTGKNASALALVNGTGTLNLTARIQNFYTGGKYMQMAMALVLTGSMPGGFVPKGIVISVEDNYLGGVIGFNTDNAKLINATFWSNYSESSGYDYARVGCLPTTSVFEFRTVLLWKIYNLSAHQIPTLDIEAQLLGSHSEVIAVSTVVVVYAP
ncbi:MAG: hypothetical protein GXO25_01110 [Euryarchaeota archaeon]|nr:hypothetical protein [Euryarchaeota archaeon]